MYYWMDKTCKLLQNIYTYKEGYLFPDPVGTNEPELHQNKLESDSDNNISTAPGSLTSSPISSTLPSPTYQSVEVQTDLCPFWTKKRSILKLTLMQTSLYLHHWWSACIRMENLEAPAAPITAPMQPPMLTLKVPDFTGKREEFETFLTWFQLCYFVASWCGKGWDVERHASSCNNKATNYCTSVGGIWMVRPYHYTWLPQALSLIPSASPSSLSW